jgi:hypothetical protein
MFANIHARSAQVLGDIMDHFPDKFRDMSKGLRDPAMFRDALDKLDKNGDGSVTPSELMSINAEQFTNVANEVPSLAAYLPYIEQEMGLGAGGEIMANLPGASRKKLKNTTASQMGEVTWRIARGLTVRKQVTQLQLEGFCDGSVKPGAASLFGDGSVRFAKGSFSALLDAKLDPQQHSKHMDRPTKRVHH